MARRWILLVALSGSLCWGQQPQPPAPAPGAPPAIATPVPQPVARFATVTAATRERLDSKSCVSGKEFRGVITSPFIFADEQIESGAEFTGHVQACNHGQNDKLSMAVVIIDMLALPNKQVVPIEALLQALGEPIPTVVIPLEGEGNRFDSTLWTAIAPPWAPHRSDVHTAATKGPSHAGILDNTSYGVIGYRHLNIENMANGNALAWVFTSASDALEIKEGSQLVVRFRIARPQAASK